MKYKTREGEVEALRYVNAWDVLRWVEKVAKGSVRFYCHDGVIEIPSPEGLNQIASPGDYIVCSKRERFYPLPRYLFELIYEPTNK